jgi:glycosyltransferase involved in cell wall biosynthesis
MTTPTKQTISVIICAYTLERWHDLVAAVESVQHQTVPPSEIIVVIDHNPEMLLRAQEQLLGIIVTGNSEERGLSGARNSGIILAHGDLMAFLDDDAIAKPQWLEQLCQNMHNPDILGSGGTVLPYWVEHKPSWLPEEFYWVVGCTYRGLPRETAPVRNPIGASMCIRRDVFVAVGGFRSGIGRVGTRPVGCEETELCIRASQYWPQRTFLFQPLAQVSHRVPRQRTSWQYFRARCYAEGISKAFVARFVGAKDSLSAESSYTLQTLPKGVLRNLKAVLFHHDLAGLARAGAIVAGLLVTTCGYLVGRCFSHPISSEPHIIQASIFKEAINEQTS